MIPEPKDAVIPTQEDLDNVMGLLKDFSEYEESRHYQEDLCGIGYY